MTASREQILPSKQTSEKDVDKDSVSSIENRWRIPLLLLLSLLLWVGGTPSRLLDLVVPASLFEVLLVTRSGAVVQVTVLGARVRNMALLVRGSCSVDDVVWMCTVGAVVQVLVLMLVGNVQSGIMIGLDPRHGGSIVAGGSVGHG